LRHRILTRRFGTGAAAAALFAGVVAGFAVSALPASATPIPPATGTCTYTDTNTSQSSQDLLIVHPDDVISISCTGLTTNGSTVENGTVAIAEASGLAAIASGGGGASGFADTAHVVLGSASSGNFSGSFTVGTTGDATHPFTPSNGDAGAVCPPNQAQINSGIVGCNLAVADVASTTGLNTLIMVWASESPPNDPPNLTLAPTSGAAGDVLTASDTGCATPVTATSHCWWGAGDTGATSGTGTPPQPPNSITAAIDGTALASSALNLNISLGVYCASGATASACTSQPLDTLIGPHLSGTITTPGTLAAGSHTVEVDEVNETPFPGSGTLAIIPPGQVANVGAKASFSAFGAPTITPNPTSAGAGATVSLSGTNWDPQGGAVTCQFTTAATGKTVDSTNLGTPNASGAVSGSINVTSNEATGSNPITCTQTAKDGATLTATASFTVLALSSTCSIDGTGLPTSCSVQQVVAATVSGTNLTITEQTTAAGTVINGLTCNGNPDPLHVTLTGVTLGNGNGTNNQQFEGALGCINRVQVSDDRGTLAGWTVNATMESDFLNATPSGNNGPDCAGLTNKAPRAPWAEFTSSSTPEVGWPSGKNWPTGNPTGTVNTGTRTYNTGPESNNGDNCIPAENLEWWPAVSTTTPSSCSTLNGVSVCGPSNLSNEVFAGPADVLSTGAATNLCYAPGGGGGGGTNCDANLDLEVPPYVAAGTYSATMNITVQ
jgi:hypothetical protein